jgi:4-hydroxybutyrate CoA-transferase
MVSVINSDWKTRYRDKIRTAAEAVTAIKSGDAVYVHSNAAAPIPVLDAMVDRASELRHVQIYQILTLGLARYAEEKYQESFRLHSLFIGANVRDAVNKGRADYTPVFLSEIPNLFASEILPVDVALIQVSPPDAHGYCSYGVSVDCTIAARKKAKITIAEVNEQMPRTLGRSFVHVDRITYLVPSNRPLPVHESLDSGEAEAAIAKNCASLISDGATLQMGIGGIPDAVLKNIGDRKNLGVHSEMFSDGVLDLVESGAITNDLKTVLPGKIATSFCFGTKRLYDFIDNNPLFEFQPSDFINDPFVISQNYHMTSINSAIQVDLTGQVCSDSIGETLFSGFGGQVDFVRGASRSKGGKSIIAIPSTAKDGKISRIVPRLAQGAGVVTTRADVHYVITEYGIASLYGRNLRDRAKLLIGISHPKFREDLERQAQQIGWMR